MYGAWGATLGAPGGSWRGHQPGRYPGEGRKLCSHGSNNIHLLASEVILLKQKSVRAGAPDSDIYHYDYLKNPQTILTLVPLPSRVTAWMWPPAPRTRRPPQPGSSSRRSSDLRGE